MYDSTEQNMERRSGPHHEPVIEVTEVDFAENKIVSEKLLHHTLMRTITGTIHLELIRIPKREQPKI